MQAEDDFKEEPELLFTSGRRLSEFHAANFAVAWNAFYQDVIFRCASPDEQRAVCELLVESLFRLYGYHHPQSLEFIHTLAELSEDQEEQAQILALEHVIFVTFFQEESEQLDQESYRLMYSLRPGEELPEEARGLLVIVLRLVLEPFRLLQRALSVHAIAGPHTVGKRVIES
mmetsp:Transcript_17756/g.39104  ORF Transcript_17756/g.39104 Transcript_17756/m.39104 type:complete len:173 (+) Transcript_17756:1194-1712(+)